MFKNKAHGYAEPIQPALPGTHDVAWLESVADLACNCECDACPPWKHCVTDCYLRCETLRIPHRVIRGYTKPRNAAALPLSEGRSFGENEPE